MSIVDISESNSAGPTKETASWKPLSVQQVPAHSTTVMQSPSPLGGDRDDIPFPIEMNVSGPSDHRTRSDVFKEELVSLIAQQVDLEPDQDLLSYHELFGLYDEFDVWIVTLRGSRPTGAAPSPLLGACFVFPNEASMEKQPAATVFNLCYAVTK